MLWKRDLVGVSPHSTASLSGPRILYWIRPRMTGRKGWGITWTILLANIFHPLSPQVNFSRRIQEKLNGAKGRVRELERRRSKEGEREVQELLIPATVNGRAIAPRTCLALGWIAHKWDKAAHLYQSLLSFRA